MKTVPEEAALFRAECMRWQTILGLQDWCLTVKAEKATQNSDTEAVTDYDCDTRSATIIFYYGIEDATHPTDVAYHEMLHLLFSDMLFYAVQARDESDQCTAREEHRVIQRLVAARGQK